ncbi:MAG: Uma2 family endonuclease [Sphingomonadaceae bacterium]
MTLPFFPPNLPRVARLRVEDFMLLNENGAFSEYAKSELIDGEIICMNAQYSRHGRAKSIFSQRLAAAAAAANLPYEIWTETAVHLSADSMPEPDIILTDFRGQGPIPLESAALIVEVSDTTVDYDLGRKARIYAQAGVREYWVLDVENARLVVHHAPEGSAYTSKTEFPLGIMAQSITIEGLIASTTDLVD